MAIMHLSKENFTCWKEHSDYLSLYLILLKQYINSSENSMKPDINSLVNSVDPDQLASEEAN